MTSESNETPPSQSDEPESLRENHGEVSAEGRLKLSPLHALAGAIAGVIAATAAFYLIVEVEKTFTVSQELDDRMAEVLIEPSADLRAEYDAANLAAEQKNHALMYAGTAALLGFFIVPALAITSRKAAGRTLAGLVGGTVVGVLSGGVAGFIGMTIADKLELTEKIDPILETIVVHSVIWSLVAVGAIVGISVVAGVKETFGRALIGGLLGALAGAALFPVVAALIFIGLTNSTLPGESEAHGMRTFFLILPSVTIAIGLSCAISGATSGDTQTA